MMKCSLYLILKCSIFLSDIYLCALYHHLHQASHSYDALWSPCCFICSALRAQRFPGIFYHHFVFFTLSCLFSCKQIHLHNVCSLNVYPSNFFFIVLYIFLCMNSIQLLLSFSWSFFPLVIMLCDFYIILNDSFFILSLHFIHTYIIIHFHLHPPCPVSSSLYVAAFHLWFSVIGLPTA